MAKNYRKQYQEVMEEIKAAQKDFREVWTAARTEAMGGRIPPLSLENGEKLWAANGVAYQKARLWDIRRYNLVSRLSGLLPWQEFEANDPSAIDAMIDFCEIDIPTFQVGYWKEWIYGQFKELTLTEAQAERLRNLALYFCGLSAYRRELTHLGRLLIRLADQRLIDELQTLLTSDNLHVREKSQIMIDKIRPHRTDLSFPRPFV